MVVQTKLLQDSCKKILDAVVTGTESENLELQVIGRDLHLSVASNEYYVSVKIPLDIETPFHAVVSAKLFLTLVSKFTTKDVDLNVTQTYLAVKANGNYKLPLVCDNMGNMISLRKITIDNETNSFTISNDILQSILKYNLKVWSGNCDTAVKKLFYIDDKGAITYNNGACVNGFNLAQPVTLFLTEKVIRLFKLFKNDVTFTIGQDEFGDSFITKVGFTDENVSLYAALNIDSSITGTFPVSAIRRYSETVYQNTVNLNKADMLDAINRLSLFTDKNAPSYVFIEFGNDQLTLYDARKENSEVIEYNGTTLDLPENCTFPYWTSDLRLTLETCDEEFLNLSFGDKSIIISRGTVKNIIARKV